MLIWLYCEILNVIIYYIVMLYISGEVSLKGEVLAELKSEEDEGLGGGIA